MKILQYVHQCRAPDFQNSVMWERAAERRRRPEGKGGGHFQRTTRADLQFESPV